MSPDGTLSMQSLSDNSSSKNSITNPKSASALTGIISRFSGTSIVTSTSSDNLIAENSKISNNSLKTSINFCKMTTSGNATLLEKNCSLMKSLSDLIINESIPPSPKETAIENIQISIQALESLPVDCPISTNIIEPIRIKRCDSKCSKLFVKSNPNLCRSSQSSKGKENTIKTIKTQSNGNRIRNIIFKSHPNSCCSPQSSKGKCNMIDAIKTNSNDNKVSNLIVQSNINSCPSKQSCKGEGNIIESIKTQSKDSKANNIMVKSNPNSCHSSQNDKGNINEIIKTLSNDNKGINIINECNPNSCCSLPSSEDKDNKNETIKTQSHDSKICKLIVKSNPKSCCSSQSNKGNGSTTETIKTARKFNKDCNIEKRSNTNIIKNMTNEEQANVIRSNLSSTLSLLRLKDKEHTKTIESIKAENKANNYCGIDGYESGVDYCGEDGYVSGKDYCGVDGYESAKETLVLKPDEFSPCPTFKTTQNFTQICTNEIKRNDIGIKQSNSKKNEVSLSYSQKSNLIPIRRKVISSNSLKSNLNQKNNLMDMDECNPIDINNIERERNRIKPQISENQITFKKSSASILSERKSDRNKQGGHQIAKITNLSNLSNMSRLTIRNSQCGNINKEEDLNIINQNEDKDSNSPCTTSTGFRGETNKEKGDSINSTNKNCTNKDSTNKNSTNKEYKDIDTSSLKENDSRSRLHSLYSSHNLNNEKSRKEIETCGTQSNDNKVNNLFIKSIPNSCCSLQSNKGISNINKTIKTQSSDNKTSNINVKSYPNSCCSSQSNKGRGNINKTIKTQSNIIDKSNSNSCCSSQGNKGKGNRNKIIKTQSNANKVSNIIAKSNSNLYCSSQGNKGRGNIIETTKNVKNNPNECCSLHSFKGGTSFIGTGNTPSAVDEGCHIERNESIINKVKSTSINDYEDQVEANPNSNCLPRCFEDKNDTEDPNADRFYSIKSKGAIQKRNCVDNPSGTKPPICYAERRMCPPDSFNQKSTTKTQKNQSIKHQILYINQPNVYNKQPEIYKFESNKVKVVKMVDNFENKDKSNRKPTFNGLKYPLSIQNRSKPENNKKIKYNNNTDSKNIPCKNENQKQTPLTFGNNPFFRRENQFCTLPISCNKNEKKTQKNTTCSKRDNFEENQCCLKSTNSNNSLTSIEQENIINSNHGSATSIFSYDRYSNRKGSCDRSCSNSSRNCNKVDCESNNNNTTINNLKSGYNNFNSSASFKDEEVSKLLGINSPIGKNVFQLNGVILQNGDDSKSLKECYNLKINGDRRDISFNTRCEETQLRGQKHICIENNFSLFERKTRSSFDDSEELNQEIDKPEILSAAHSTKQLLNAFKGERSHIKNRESSPSQNETNITDGDLGDMEELIKWIQNIRIMSLEKFKEFN